MKKNIIGISTLTLVTLYGLLGAIIILAFILAGGSVLVGIGVSLVVLVLQFFISPWLTDLSMKWIYRAQFGEAIPDYLRTFIEAECQKHNVKYPKIAIIHDGAPNAFTYGRTKKDARLVLTEGIFNLLNEREVIAVVGHEIGHIVHYDMLFMTAVQAVPLILYGIYEMLAKRNNDNDNNKAALVGYVAYILYLISQYIILYLSRTREYFADAFSVDETKDPASLAEALVKIGFGLSTSSSGSNKAANALGIFDAKTSKSMVITCMDNGQVSKEKIKNAMKWEMWNPWAKWFEFNSTHPLISKRLEEISKKSYEYNQEPYVKFDLQKPESYIDDFILEVLISFAPSFILLCSIIAFLVSDFDKFYFCFGLLFALGFSYYKFDRSHKNRNYNDTKVSNLLSEVKVSHITSIPCTLEGTIIGRGNPGCIFNEDFVIKDDTGIIFLDYNQPLNIVNKIFALFKSEQYFNKIIKVRGWYRRSPVPYVEIKTMEIDGQVKKIWTYPFRKALYIIAVVVLIIFTFI